MVALVLQRCRQLALLRVAPDQQVEPDPSAACVDLSLRRYKLRPDRRSWRDIRPRTKWIACRGGCENRQRDLDPRKHERHDQPGHELLGKHRWPGSAIDLRDEQHAPGTGCENRQINHDVWHERLYGLTNRHRWS